AVRTEGSGLHMSIVDNTLPFLSDTGISVTLFADLVDGVRELVHSFLGVVFTFISDYSIVSRDPGAREG
ncbi:hypothetical protein BGW38_008707, partial [Lunasporangiospora selenospora]